MKRQFFVFGIFLMIGSALAVPDISGVVGDFSDGQELSLSGSDFLFHSLDIEFTNEEIESHSLGLVSDWGDWNFEQDGSQAEPYIVDNEFHSGEKSIYVDIPIMSGSIHRYDYPGQVGYDDDVFVSWWVRRNRTGNHDYQWKMFRAGYSLNSFVDSYTPQFKWFEHDGNYDEFFINPSGSTTISNGGPPWPEDFTKTSFPSEDNKWYRVDIHMHTSSARGVADGYYTHNLYDPESGLLESHSSSGWTTFDTGVNDYYKYFFWQNWMETSQLTSHKIWFDDHYVQVGTEARVELCESSSWGSRVHCELQLPASWSSGSIEITANQGSFEDGDTAYLFVVDDNGEVSEGYPVTISGEAVVCVNGATVGCSTGLLGICSGGLRTCLDGVYGVCVQDNVSVEEVCGNGIDEDCDGSDLVCVDFVVDHTSAQQFDSIPESWIEAAKDNLHVVYQHTSHGSQLISGMNALENYIDYAGLYEWSDGGYSGLDLDDVGIPGAADLGYEDAWPVATRTLLDNPSNSHVNVVLWSWCNIAGHDIVKYLADMDSLIVEYPDVDFVYITGHANGGGEGDSSDSQNELIRAHVAANGGILFDFADFENYDPDDNYFLDLNVQDDLDYTGGNWASEYLGRNVGSDYESLTDLVSSCAHSDINGDSKLNCVLKGQGAWYLFARLAGWDGSSGECVDGDLDGYCVGVDCNDSNELVYPGAEEVCGNGVDEDCDGEDLDCVCVHDADLVPCDGEVSVGELGDYIELWLGGGKTISEVMSAVVVWVDTR